MSARSAQPGPGLDLERGGDSPSLSSAAGISNRPRGCVCPANKGRTIFIDIVIIAIIFIFWVLLAANVFGNPHVRGFFKDDRVS